MFEIGARLGDDCLDRRRLYTLAPDSRSSHRSDDHRRANRNHRGRVNICTSFRLYLLGAMARCRA